MVRRTISGIAVFIVIATAVVPVTAQVAGYGALQGRVYFDLKKGLSDSNEDILTYRFRRIYFGYDMVLGEYLKGRFLVDAGQDPSGSHFVFIKHAYAEWMSGSSFTLRVGQQGTILYGDIEGVWDYRSISKTFQDNSGVRASADLGISGTYTPNSLIRVRAMMSNGNGYKSKDDDAYGKSYEVQGLITPTDGLIISAFYGMNGFDPDDDPDTGNNENSTTTDISVSYTIPTFAAGGSYTMQTNHSSRLGSDGSGFWGFARYKIKDSPFGFLVRFDSWDPDTGVDDNTETYMIAGLDYSGIDGIHIIPNFQQVKVGSGDAENTFLLTFYWRW